MIKYVKINHHEWILLNDVVDEIMRAIVMYMNEWPFAFAVLVGWI